MSFFIAVVDPVSQAIIWNLIIGVALAGASYAISRAMASRRKRIPFDRTETMLSRRGSQLPRLVGRNTVPVILAWAGRRRRDSRDGADIYFEDGWGLICVGTAFAVHQIIFNERGLLDKPIYRSSTPSGTRIKVKGQKLGYVTIYWGERDQPVSAFLANPKIKRGKKAFVGIPSRWPHVAYIVFEGVNLGSSPASGWPNIQVDVEVRPQDHPDPLVNSPAYLAPSAADRNDDGPNAGRVLHELLTLPHPQGLAIPSDLIDKPGFEELGILAKNEQQPAHLYPGQDEAADADTVIQDLMNDVDFMLNTVAGKLRPYPVRAVPSGATLPQATVDVTQDPFPQEVRQHGSFGADSPVFKFLDQSLGHQPYALPLPDDGSTLARQRPQQSTIELATVRSRQVAWMVAWRMKFQLIGNTQPLTQVGNRELRLLQPGQPYLTADGHPARVQSIEELSMTSSRVKIQAVYEFYAVPTPPYRGEDVDDIGSTPISLDPDADPYYRALAVDIGDEFETFQVAGPGEIRIPLRGFMVIRARANEDIIGAEVWISRLGNSYTKVGRQDQHATGATLDSSIGDSSAYITTGPVVTSFAQDDMADIAVDLTNEEARYFAGEMTLLVDDELMLVRNVVDLGAGKYRLDGITRGIDNTAVATHAINAKLLLFNRSLVAVHRVRASSGGPIDGVVIPNSLALVKTLPESIAGDAVDINDVAPTTFTVL